ncbi:MAG: TIGR02171 family protein [Fibrobacter sp.]|nr:TIGR02171 family protein [Fibrobacter sp.]
MKRFLWIALLAFVLMGCLESSDGGGSSSEETSSFMMRTDPVHSGMIFVYAEKSTATLGTTSSEARASERPQMNVDFDYNYSISRSEVTCEEFNAYVSSTKECSGDSLPVTRVSYYDAVLFANEKSKAEGFDTAYVYSQISFNSDKSVAEIQDLTFRNDVDAYRLPTEAEWTLVASQDWNPSKGWNSENSDYKAHSICTADSSTICDMAGNVSEWVNDWLGKFKDTTLTNFIGASDGGSIGERIIKGGSFRDSPASITLYARGDVYSVTASSKSDYVGFRLAFGKIPNPVWLNSNGEIASSLVTPLANSHTLHWLMGTYQTKLAFRNDETGNLAYIDYSNANLSAVEIVDTIDSYHPEISPDGNRVAFCTKPEGITGKSSLYVRDLNATGSNLVKLDVESAAIPRWRVLSDGDTVLIYVDDAGNNQDDATFKSHSTWKVSFRSGKFGIPEKILDGNYHDGYNENSNLAISGARLLRAHRNGKDVTWYDGEQACNASLAQDGSNRTLFLDFGGSLGQSFTETAYAAHEQLLIVDSTGTLIQAIPAPEGYAYDHSEWTLGGSQANFAVATLTNSLGAHQKIVLIHLSRGEVYELAEGEELWHPSFWTKTQPVISDKLNADSAGVYFASGGEEAEAILRYKMELLWRFRDTTNVLVLGSSRSNSGVVSDKFDSDYFVLNLSNIPNSLYVSSYLFENYAIPHLSKLKYLVLSLDIDMWYKKKNVSEDNFFYERYKKTPGYVYDANHDFWKSGYPEGLAELTENSPGNYSYRDWLIFSRGFMDSDCGGWEKNAAVDKIINWYESDSSAFLANYKELERILALASEKNIQVIGVIFPMSPLYQKTLAYGRYGLSRSLAPDLIARIQELSQTYSNFTLMDENQMGNHDYTSAMAQNRDHLCTAGALQMTERLNAKLHSLE